MAKQKSNKSGKQSYIFTRETFGMTLMLFSLITMFILFTGNWALGQVGAEICRFMYGSFGYGAYAVVVLAAYFGFWLVSEKSIKVRPALAIAIAAVVLMVFLLAHAVSTRNFDLQSYGGYLSTCYNNAIAGWAGYTFGGAISGLLVYPVAKLATSAGAYAVFSVLLLLCAYLLFVAASRRKIFWFLRRKKESGDELPAESAEQETEPVEQPQVVTEEQVQPPVTSQAGGQDGGYYNPYETPSQTQQYYDQTQPYAQQQQDYPPEAADDDKFSQRSLGRKILFENDEFAAESYRRNLIFSEDSYFNHPVRNDSDYLKSFSSNPSATQNPVPPQQQTYTQSYQDQVVSQPVTETPSSYVYGDTPAQTFGDDSYPQPPTETQQDGQFTDVPVADEYADSIGRTETAEEPAVNPDRTAETHTDRDFFADDSTPSANTRGTQPETNPEETIEPVRRREQPDEVRREPPAQNGDGQNILSSIFGGESMRGDRGRVEDGGADRSNRNLFDDDGEVDLGEDVFGVSSRDRGGLDRDIRGANRNTEPQQDRSVPPVVPPVTQPSAPSANERTVGFDVSSTARRGAEPPKEEPKPVEKPKHVWKKYDRPPIDLLDDYPENNNVNTGEIEDNKRIIVDILANFKIECEVANVTVGPSLTRYDVVIADKTKTRTALSYRDDIALALMKKNVNTYLNYTKGAISIEVPNNQRSVVGLKTMLTSSQFINSKPNSLTFGLGKNIDGEVVCPDITKMPHLLVAGTTGSGKSICLSTLLISLLYKYGPDELRLILVDPKQAEFIPYNRLPHLMINEILDNVNKVIKALNWAIAEMNRRYTLFKEMTENGVVTKTLSDYNAHLPEGEEKMPKILIVLDEFADLMMRAKKDIEDKIIILAQKSRACGIHLILATQRPSVDCITGLIKSNLPTRIGFKVNSFADSSTIFDVGGAEKLLGMGDMYYRSVDNPELVRLQGCFVGNDEVQRVTDYVRSHNETYFDQSVSDFINKPDEPEVSDSRGGEDNGEDGGDAKIDDTFIKALKFCVTSKQASVSMIQRRFPVGYIKACKIIDWMENMNYITQSEGSKPRKVLLSMDEFISTYGEVDD